jgi:hypothetical protein
VPSARSTGRGLEDRRVEEATEGVAEVRNRLVGKAGRAEEAEHPLHDAQRVGPGGRPSDREPAGDVVGQHHAVRLPGEVLELVLPPRRVGVGEFDLAHDPVVDELAELVLAGVFVVFGALAVTRFARRR